MTPDLTQDRAWRYWQQAQSSLESVAQAMQVLGTIASLDPPQNELPDEYVQQVRKDMTRFAEKFELLVRAQPAKAVL